MLLLQRMTLCSFLSWRKCLKTHWIVFEEKDENLRWLQQNVWDEKESVVGLLIPICTGCASAVCKQAVDEQKTESHQLSEKGFVFLFFFLDYIKSREQRGLQFFVLLYLPCDSLQLENKTFAWPSMVPHSTSQAEDSLRTGNLFFFFFLCFLLILKLILERSHRSYLPGSTAGPERRLRSCFLVIHVGLMTPTDLCVVVPNRRGHISQVKFACFVSIDCTDFFQRYLCIFFSTAKTQKNKKRKNTKKKNHKKTWKKYDTKTILSRSTRCIQNKHTYSVYRHTHTRLNTAVSLLTAKTNKI